MGSSNRSASRTRRRIGIVVAVILLPLAVFVVVTIVQYTTAKAEVSERCLSERFIHGLDSLESLAWIPILGPKARDWSDARYSLCVGMLAEACQTVKDNATEEARLQSQDKFQKQLSEANEQADRKQKVELILEEMRDSVRNPNWLPQVDPQRKQRVCADVERFIKWLNAKGEKNEGEALSKLCAFCSEH